MAYGFNNPQGFASQKSITGGDTGGKLGEYTISSGMLIPIFNGDLVRYANLADINAAVLATRGTIVPMITANGNNAATVGVLPVLGVFRGCKYHDLNNNLVRSQYYPAALAVYPNTEIIALVDDDPNIIGSIQISTSLTDITANLNAMAFTTGFKGMNAYVNIVSADGAAWANPIPYSGMGNPSINIQPANPIVGNSIMGQSAYYLDAASIVYNNGHSTYSLKIIGLDSDPTNLVAANTVTTIVGGAAGGAYRGLFVNYLVKINNHVYGSTGTPSPITA